MRLAGSWNLEIFKLKGQLMLLERWCISPVLRIHLILIRIQVMNISLRIAEFFITKQNEPYKEIFILYTLSFFNSSDLGFDFESKKVFLLQFLVDILPLGFRGSAYFCGSGIRSSKPKLADITDPDPKHCVGLKLYS